MKKTGLLSFIFCFLFLANLDAQTKPANTVSTKTCLRKVRLGNIDSSYVTSEQILAKPEFISLDSDCVVTSFKVFIISQKGNDIASFESHSRYLTNEMKQYIRGTASDWSRITIDNITLLCHNTEKCTSAPLFFQRKKANQYNPK